MADLMKVVNVKGLLEYIKVWKLPTSNIVFLQFHIHGTNCVFIISDCTPWKTLPLKSITDLQNVWGYALLMAGNVMI
jgi:hypothetical protein